MRQTFDSSKFAALNFHFVKTQPLTKTHLRRKNKQTNQANKARQVAPVFCASLCVCFVHFARALFDVVFVSGRATFRVACFASFRGLFLQFAVLDSREQRKSEQSAVCFLLALTFSATRANSPHFSNQARKASAERQKSKTEPKLKQSRS